MYQPEGSDEDPASPAWSADHAVMRDGHKILRCNHYVDFADALLIAAFDRLHPRASEVITAEGMAPFDSAAVLPQLVCEDAYFRKACQDGEALADIHKTEFRNVIVPVSVCSQGIVRYGVKRDPIQSQRLWCVAAYHCGGLFSTEETATLDRLLEHWIRYFHVPREPGLVRLVADHDDGIILINESGKRLLIYSGIKIDKAIALFRSVVHQRYPEFCDNNTHDMVISLGDRPWWIRYEKRHPLGISEEGQQHIEMRPLEPDEVVPVGLIKDTRIAKAIAYLHDHYRESPGLTEVSTASGIGFYYCHRLFCEHTGMSPKHYLWQIQMLNAKMMLRSSLMPINEIARKVGFPNHGHFTSLFTRLNGMNPRIYRKKWLVIGYDASAFRS